jgi:hypothetical protein
MTRNVLLAATVLGAAAVLGLTGPGAAEEKAGVTRLFNGKDFTGWRKFVDPKSGADPDKIWQVKGGEIVCEGSVNGYLITEKEYGDFELRLQWRWGDKVTSQRNSGVFVWVSGPDKIWPRAVEAQLFINHAGDIWLVDGFKLDVDSARRDPRTPNHFLRTKDKVEKEVGQWNQYEITCKGDTLKLVVNGQLVNEGRGAERTRGKVLLQSEGAEIHFRNIELKHLR